MGKRRRFLILISCILLLIILYTLFTALAIAQYGNIDERTVSDVAIVLGAGTWDNEVSPVYRERINHGVWLYENGYVDHLILTGGMGDGNSISDAEAAKRYALFRSVPEEVIFIEEKSTITEENLEYAKHIMEENDLNTAIIVSDPLHMKRAMHMARDYGIRACSSPTPTTMYRSLKTQIPFLCREVFFYTGYLILSIFR